MRQALLELQPNAIKLTGRGSDTLSANNKGDELLTSVADTSPGIPKENSGARDGGSQAHIAHIFIELTSL